MKILGIAAFYHDSSACLINEGQIIAATQEERWSRIKHDSKFPVKSIAYCLEQANLHPENVDQIVFYEKPFLKFERLVETYLAFAPQGFTSFRKALPLWLNEKLFQKKLLKAELKKLGFSDILMEEAVVKFNRFQNLVKTLPGLPATYLVTFSVMDLPGFLENIKLT